MKLPMIRLLFCTTLLLLAACSDRKSPETPAAADTGNARAERSRIQGADSAAVWMLIASDFECPYCKLFHEDQYRRIVDEYVRPGKLRVAFLHHPKDFHRRAIPAAEAAMCAGREGRFWEMHDQLFLHQERWVQAENPMPIWDSLATSIGVDATRWRECIRKRTTLDMVMFDLRRTVAQGVDATPSFIIGGSLAVIGAQPYEHFKAAIDSALARAATKPAGGN